MTKMKYMQPSTEVVRLDTLSMIAASGGAAPKFDPNDDTSVMESRRHNYNVWGNE